MLLWMLLLSWETDIVKVMVLVDTELQMWVSEQKDHSALVLINKLDLDWWWKCPCESDTLTEN